MIILEKEKRGSRGNDRNDSYKRAMMTFTYERINFIKWKC